MAEPVNGRSFVGTFGLVLLAITSLFAVDTFLAKSDRAANHAESARLYREGQRAMLRGDYAEAVERFKDATAVERGNRDYMLALAHAQLASGKTAAAESTASEVLETDANDGPASLIMARGLVKEGRFEQAVSYFHRAIFGHWTDDAAENRLRVRFELIDLLAQHNSKEELLAELLPVQEEAPGDLQTRTRLGHLYLQAGSPARAADVFHGILRDDPSNAPAFAGLGEAEFARADYRSAERDYQAALRLAPADVKIRSRLDLCRETLALDPAQRGLSPAERLRRSQHLLELALEEARRCAGATPPPELAAEIDRASAAMKARKIPHQSEAAESNLDLAAQLWQIRKRSCQPPPDPNTPQALVLTKLSQ